jgi:hypothetical protein
MDGTDILRMLKSQVFLVSGKLRISKVTHNELYSALQSREHKIKIVLL